MKKLEFKTFTTTKRWTVHSKCSDYLDEELSNKRYKGIYIEANDNKIRPGIGILLKRIKKHSPGQEKNTERLKGFRRKYILVIPLMEYYDDRFICDSELSYLETKLIELIKRESIKENLANKSYEEGDLHETQIEELNKLFKKIIRGIKKYWNKEFYGKA